ncbi:MAG TPA: hypothetical protein VM261_19980 [Kofleriaceae bacterium]|nr:hypothetical protein [Kofleriaceae bacterium]
MRQGSLLLMLAAVACSGGRGGEPRARDAVPPPATAPGSSDAPPVLNPEPADVAARQRAYDAHIAALRERLAAADHGDLDIRVEEPFVVLGDDGPDVLERRARTVRWAVEHLERDFFDKRPTRILDVYLFGNARSYQRGVKALTGSAPTTPYGFYSSEHDGLFMNIATGGGTLVHEIVHPYVEADFPEAPPWLNEGLGSLFEQSSEENGHIVGETNWRLAGLQEAIREGSVPTFHALTKMSEHAFYVKDRGTNYAQARYLLYYLQEQGKLRDYYRAFRAARGTDPTGYDTLVAALGERDMAAFQRRWEAYVLRLRFDG